MSDSNAYFNERNVTVFSAEELVAIFRQSSEKIATLHVYASDDFNVLSQHIRAYYQHATAILENISKVDAHGLNPGKSVRAQAEESLNNISTVVTRLQFHDIIRQQLEHVQQTNACIIEELISVSRQHVRVHTRETYKYLSIVPDIARLHVAQLTHTNKEYQEAFADIKANLFSIQQQTGIIASAYTAVQSSAEQTNQANQIIEIAHALSSAINHSLEQIKHEVSFEQVITEINESLIRLMPNQTQQTDKTAVTDNKLITHLKNLYTMESERIVHEQAFGKTPATTIRPETDANLELF